MRGKVNTFFMTSRIFFIVEITLSAMILFHEHINQHFFVKDYVKSGGSAVRYGGPNTVQTNQCTEVKIQAFGLVTHFTGNGEEKKNQCHSS